MPAVMETVDLISQAVLPLPKTQKLKPRYCTIRGCREDVKKRISCHTICPKLDEWLTGHIDDYRNFA